ncbi:MAG: DUF350 domain-containing protein [Bacteroidetes bacterium]|nr:DUF350 domain-containing protein [Bacteroidota bacterium]
MNEFLSTKPLISSLVYSVIGIAVLVFAFWVIDRLVVRHNLWKEIVEKQNTALAILAAGFMLALGWIIAAAIHG